MGRWAQAQRRGTVAPGETVGGGFPAPVYGVDWTVTNETFDGFQANFATAGPGHALVNMTTTEHPLSSSQGLDATPGPVDVPANDGVAGDHYTATAQWCTAGGTPLSPLSTAHTGVLAS